MTTNITHVEPSVVNDVVKSVYSTIPEGTVRRTWNKEQLAHMDEKKIAMIVEKKKLSVEGLGPEEIDDAIVAKNTLTGDDILKAEQTAKQLNRIRVLTGTDFTEEELATMSDERPETLERIAKAHGLDEAISHEEAIAFLTGKPKTAVPWTQINAVRARIYQARKRLDFWEKPQPESE